MLAQAAGFYTVNAAEGYHSLYPDFSPGAVAQNMEEAKQLFGSLFDSSNWTRNGYSAQGAQLLYSFHFITVVFAFLFVDLFDTLGTVIGTASQSNMLDPNGRLGRIRGVLLADSLATSAGAVGGPSTYLYYDRRRPDGKGHFTIPKMKPQIYDSWHCGLLNRNAYALNCSPEQIIKNISSRYTLYFCGEQDTSYKHLSVDPGSMQQGKNRTERFCNYREYNKLFPEWHRCTAFFSCPNAGHSTIRVFSHPAFLDLIFGKRPFSAPQPEDIQQ